MLDLLRPGLALVAGCIALSGCGGSGDQSAGNRPTTYPATGSVIFQGAPVAGATVVFQPEGEGQTAVGMTDTQGKFTLKTFVDGDGAIAGKYKVRVEKIEETRGPVSDPEAPLPPIKVVSHLPDIYGKIETSPLEATVQVDGDNKFDFMLEGEPPAAK